MSAKQATETKTTKKVKARVLNEDNELVMSIITVPVTDKRPEYNPATDTVASGSDVLEGNPMKNAPIGKPYLGE